MRFLFLLICLSLMHSNAFAAEKEQYIFLRPKSALDTRYDYHIELAKEALAVTEKEYGPAEIIFSDESYPHPRAFSMLSLGTDQLHLMIRATSKEDEKKLQPVRFPLDKGLLATEFFSYTKTA